MIREESVNAVPQDIPVWRAGRHNVHDQIEDVMSKTE
jgi:hypothetical protein